MLPLIYFQIFSITADLLLFVFVGYYLWTLHAKQKELEIRERKSDSDYHHIVEDALAKERQIIDDATTEADQIIAGTEYVNAQSQKTVDQALGKMVEDIKKESLTAAQDFRKSYQASLHQLSNQSLQEFQNVAKELQTDLQKQVKTFHETLIPKMEKELEEYKQARLKETEQTITSVVQKVSQEVLNKSISIDDHQKLLLESLEKAKQEGVLR